MNFNQIINMAIRMIMRRGINAGITRGINMAGNRKKPAEDRPPQDRDTISDDRNNS